MKASSSEGRIGIRSRVEVVNLRTAPDYNGLYGTILGWHKQYQRWEVELYTPPSFEMMGQVEAQ